MSTTPYQLDTHDETLLQLALSEDLSQKYRDQTTDSLFGKQDPLVQAEIVSKEQSDVVLSGLVLIPALFEQLKQTCDISCHYNDGDSVKQGDTIVTLTAKASAVLKLERTLLNFVRHLSGIATLTHQFVQAVGNTNIKILDTRKTTPGLRRLEKYAVSCGGGVNHRMGLYDAVMVKDTHVDMLGSLEIALQKLREKSPKCPVIIEIRNEAELDTVIAHGQQLVQRVLLDNMSAEQLKLCVEKAAPYFETEVSGNLTLNKIPEVAKTGVNFASVGCITHSAKQVDLSMRVEKHG